MQLVLKKMDRDFLNCEQSQGQSIYTSRKAHLTSTNNKRSIIIPGDKKRSAKRFNLVRKVSCLKQNQKWKEMKCIATVKTATVK